MPRIGTVTDGAIMSIINGQRNLLVKMDYHSASWRQISFAIKIRDGYKCRDCGVMRGLMVHHIVPIKEGGTNTPDNLLTLCDHCHRIRHKDQNKRRYA